MSGEETWRVWPKGLLTRGQGGCWSLAIECKEKKQLRLFKFIPKGELSLFCRTKNSSVFVHADGTARPIADSKKHEELFAEVDRAGDGGTAHNMLKMEIGPDSVWAVTTTLFENDKFFNILSLYEERANRKDGWLRRAIGQEDWTRPLENPRNEDRVRASK